MSQSWAEVIHLSLIYFIVIFRLISNVVMKMIDMLWGRESRRPFFARRTDALKQYTNTEFQVT